MPDGPVWNDDNVTVAADGVVNLGTVSNFTSDVVATITLNSGTMRVTSGSGNDHLKNLVLCNGDVNTLGSGAFGLRLFGAGAGITAAGLSTMDGSTNSLNANENGECRCGVPRDDTVRLRTFVSGHPGE